METYCGVKVCPHAHSYLGTRSKWEVQFAPRVLCPHRKSPWIPTGYEAGSALPTAIIETRFFRSPVGNLVTLPTKLTRLLCKNTAKNLQYIHAVCWFSMSKENRNSWLRFILQIWWLSVLPGTMLRCVAIPAAWWQPRIIKIVLHMSSVVRNCSVIFAIRFGRFADRTRNLNRPWDFPCNSNTLDGQCM